MDMEYILPSLPSKCTWRLGTEPKTSVHQHLKTKKKPKIYPNALYGIGETPLIRLNKIPLEHGIKCEMYAKCEYFNPAGSVKDRIALRMVEDAEREGRLKPGSVLIETSSGNTGISLSFVAAIKGYRCIIIMPEHYSGEKVSFLKAFGAKIVRTPKYVLPDHPESPHLLAQKLRKEIPNSVILNQFRNPANPLAHYDTTAEEILDQLGGKVDMVVAGTGTGATITGIGRKMKERYTDCKIVGCDPFGYYDEKSNVDISMTHDVEGIGLMFPSTVLDPSVVDEWITIPDKKAFQMTRTLIQKEGLLCGGSSGSVLCAALQAAKGLDENQKCVLIFGDSIRNYMSKLMNDKWLASRGYIDIPAEVTENYWWWNFEVNCLELTMASTVLTSSFCQDVIYEMKMKNLKVFSVVDKTGKSVGITTLDTMMDKILAGTMTSHTTVSETLCNKQVEITPNSTLGYLSTVLDQEPFALVVNKKKEKQFSSSGTAEREETIISIATKCDLVNFIIGKGQGTRKNFPILDQRANGCKP